KTWPEQKVAASPKPSGASPGLICPSAGTCRVVRSRRREIDPADAVRRGHPEGLTRRIEEQVSAHPSAPADLRRHQGAPIDPPNVSEQERARVEVARSDVALDVAYRCLDRNTMANRERPRVDADHLAGERPCPPEQARSRVEHGLVEVEIRCLA